MMYRIITLSIAAVIACFLVAMGAEGSVRPDPVSLARDGQAQQKVSNHGNATITFHLHDGLGKSLAQKVKVVLTVKKAGLRSIVAGSPKPGEVDGVKKFYTGSTPSDICRFYKNLLLSSGWKLKKDFVVSGSSIHLYNTETVSSYSSHRQLDVGLCVDRKRKSSRQR